MLSEQYGWRPDDIMEMTLAQILTYLTPKDDLGVQKQMTPGQAMAFRQRKQLERELAVQRML